MTMNVIDRFDAEAAWAALPEPVRTAIGATVLSGLFGGDLIDHGREVGDVRFVRLGVALERTVDGELEALLDEVEIAGVDLPSGQPRIPAILGMICERCGCSEIDPCRGGCGWARDNLCTTCAGGPP